MKKYIFLMLLAVYCGHLGSQTIAQPKRHSTNSRDSVIRPSSHTSKQKEVFELRKPRIQVTGHRIKAKKGFPDRKGKRLKNKL